MEKKNTGTKNTEVLTALETPDCPPHWYYLDLKDQGHCQKCGVFIDYRQLAQKYDRQFSTRHYKKKGRIGEVLIREVNARQVL